MDFVSSLGKDKDWLQFPNINVATCIQRLSTCSNATNPSASLFDDRAIKAVNKADNEADNEANDKADDEANAREDYPGRLCWMRRHGRRADVVHRRLAW
jgi:hypothetical protein